MAIPDVAGCSPSPGCAASRLDYTRLEPCSQTTRPRPRLAVVSRTRFVPMSYRVHAQAVQCLRPQPGVAHDSCPAATSRTRFAPYSNDAHLVRTPQPFYPQSSHPTAVLHMLFDTRSSAAQVVQVSHHIRTQQFVSHAVRALQPCRAHSSPPTPAFRMRFAPPQPSRARSSHPVATFCTQFVPRSQRTS